MVEIPEDLKYTEDHEWCKVEGDELQFGLTSYAQEELGDIVYVELPEVGEEFDMGDMIGVVESVKTVSDIYSPVSGKVIRVNDELEMSPESINEDPYGEGWIAVIEIIDETEIEELMSGKNYKKFIE